jgi:hypothetical protein
METLTSSIPEAPPMALDRWTADVGINPSTAWQWRKRGGLKTVNVAGRHYITAAQRTEFLRRAEAGEFAQAPSGALLRHRAGTEIRGRN